MMPNLEMLRRVLCPVMLATDLADYLVRRGVPFREAHIRYAIVLLGECTEARLLGLSWRLFWMTTNINNPYATSIVDVHEGFYNEISV